MDLVDVTDLAPARDSAWRPGDVYLAGGTWVFSVPQPGVTRLLDLQSFEWESIVDTGDGLEIAATCTLAQLAAWPVPLFRQCCDALLGSFKIWNAATVGGNICLALPAGPMIALAAALDGTCVLWAPDGTTRELPVLDVVVAPQRTALAPGELLRAVRLPGSALTERAAVRQMSLSTYGRSAALVVGRRAATGATVLTITASVPRPMQVRFDEPPTPDAAADAVARAVPQWHDDVHGDPRWRAAMTARLVREVVDDLAAA